MGTIHIVRTHRAGGVFGDSSYVRCVQQGRVENVPFLRMYYMDEPIDGNMSEFNF